MVLLPRTQNGPEDLMSEGDPAVGLKTFLAELDIAQQMSGLALVRMFGKTGLTERQLADIASEFKARRARMWAATGSQVADWWRARAAITVSVDTGAAPPVLTVRIGSGYATQRTAAVWVNLPESGRNLRLLGAGGTTVIPATAAVDAWRAAVLLKGLAPGEYRWQLYFERPRTVAAM